jgi:sulfatase modifying factor 1
MRSRKNPAKASVLLCAACAPLVGSGSAFGQISIATVPVAYVNNAPDTAHNNFGSVGYEYNIGTYDVTSSQYCAFLNAVAANDVYGLYHPNRASTTEGNPGIIQNGSPGSYTYTVIDGRGNYPATDVSFFNAARFANWLDNGQPVGAEGVGTTETGAYTLSPTMDASVAALPPGQKQNYESSTQDNDAVVRSATASWAVPTENEWYKAAYFDPDRNPANYVGDYWYFPDRTDTSQIAETQMTFNISGNVNDTTPVGTYPDPSFVGTYDQGGDVYQWNESIPGGGGVRGIRGGAFDGNDVGYAADFESSKQQPWITGSVGNNGDIGFRVVQLKPLATGGLMDM